MLGYDRLTIEFYTAPALAADKVATPRLVTPDLSVISRFDVDTFETMPEGAYAFRMVPILSLKTDYGLSSETAQPITFLDSALCFLGGTHLDAAAVKEKFGTRTKAAKKLKTFGKEFVLTKGDILVPFDAACDQILQWKKGKWDVPIVAPR